MTGVQTCALPICPTTPNPYLTNPTAARTQVKTKLSRHKCLPTLLHPPVRSGQSNPAILAVRAPHPAHGEEARAWVIWNPQSLPLTSQRRLRCQMRVHALLTLAKYHQNGTPAASLACSKGSYLSSIPSRPLPLRSPTPPHQPGGQAMALYAAMIKRRCHVQKALARSVQRFPHLVSQRPS